MKFVKENFSGYNENCETIRAIKSLIQEREFTFEEINHLPYVTTDDFIKYLKPEFIGPFLKHLFGNDYFDKKYSEIKGILYELNAKLQKADYYERKFKNRYLHLLDKENLKILDKNIWLEKRWNYEFDKGEAFRFLEIIWHQSFQTESYLTTNTVMYQGFNIALETFRFEDDEFLKIMKNFNFNYWGATSIESFYANAIKSKNSSAWKSIEKAIDRKPFILKNKRMYEGRTFEMKSEKKLIKFRCTGWNDTNKIKFVTETEKQKRYSFDLKEFKEFFKDQEFRNL
jgi:hypothetical protein